MGFDVHGLEATGKDGGYFRNSVWSWHPLWGYVVREAGLDSDELVAGTHNGGDEICADTALRIADVLDERLKDGRVAAYERERAAGIEAMPVGEKRSMESMYLFREENVRAFAKFCRESGGFRIS